jgi:hypothetical protein
LHCFLEIKVFAKLFVSAGAAQRLQFAAGTLVFLVSADAAQRLQFAAGTLVLLVSAGAV